VGGGTRVSVPTGISDKTEKRIIKKPFDSAMDFYYNATVYI
jgi:hypothetical protein